jgi:hypothetical protein
MKPDLRKEIISLCQVLTLAGLVENPYPLVNARQEAEWQRAPRRKILDFIAKHYGKRAAREAARLKLFTLH